MFIINQLDFYLIKLIYIYLRFFSRKKEGPSDNPKRAKTPDPARNVDRSRNAAHRPNTLNERITPQIRVSQVRFEIC